MEVLTYTETYKQAFYDLNLEWIEKFFEPEEKDLYQIKNPEDCLRDGGQIFFVVENEIALGTCALYKTAPKCFELAKMAVSPSSQGKGLGSRLMQAAENWAREQGAEEIVLLSNQKLTPAIGLYKKHGFETYHLGEHPDYQRCDIGMRKYLLSD